MPDSALKSINFEKYFSLLHMLMPASPGFAICDTAGKLIETSGNTGDLVKGSHIDINAFKPHANGNP